MSHLLDFKAWKPVNMIMRYVVYQKSKCNLNMLTYLRKHCSKSTLTRVIKTLHKWQNRQTGISVIS